LDDRVVVAAASLIVAPADSLTGKIMQPAAQRKSACHQRPRFALVQ
jgi:hypothetical protein